MNKSQARIEALECAVAWLAANLGQGSYVAFSATDQENAMVADAIIEVQDLLQRKIDRAERGKT